MMTTPASHRVAAIQMVSGDKLQANLDAASRLVAEAARRGAQLVALPEYFYLMPADEPRRVALAEPFGDGPIQRHLAGLARTHRVWLIGGTVPLQSPAPGRMYNSSLLFDPQGECAARYDKVHLFGFHHGEQHYDEAATMCAGREPVVASTPLGRLKLSVCYDLRFPEFYRLPPAPELIAAPAAFTRTTGEAHWELLRARAVENLAYVIAAGQGATIRAASRHLDTA